MLRGLLNLLHEAWGWLMYLLLAVPFVACCFVGMGIAWLWWRVVPYKAPPRCTEYTPRPTLRNSGAMECDVKAYLAEWGV
jgi:hypothetical protein